VDVFKETVVLGNDALIKCQIPSFVQDFITVDGWVDSEGTALLQRYFASGWMSFSTFIFKA